MAKKKVNEGIFDVARKFTDKFFDGLKRNSVDDMIRRAEEVGVEDEIITKMKSIENESKELDKLIKRYSKK